jgi:hypothetical protein
LPSTVSAAEEFDRERTENVENGSGQFKLEKSAGLVFRGQVQQKRKEKEK